MGAHQYLRAAWNMGTKAGYIKQEEKKCKREEKRMQVSVTETNVGNLGSYGKMQGEVEL